MDEWLNGRMTMMTTTATTIFDATTGTLSPKVQSLVSSRVHLGKFFKQILRHTGGCAKRYYVNAAHTSPVGYQRLRACPKQQPFKGSSDHTHSTKTSDSSSTSCSFSILWSSFWRLAVLHLQNKSKIGMILAGRSSAQTHGISMAAGWSSALYDTHTIAVIWPHYRLHRCHSSSK